MEFCPSKLGDDLVKVSITAKLIILIKYFQNYNVRKVCLLFYRPTERFNLPTQCLKWPFKNITSSNPQEIKGFSVSDKIMNGNLKKRRKKKHFCIKIHHGGWFCFMVGLINTNTRLGYLILTKLIPDQLFL